MNHTRYLAESIAVDLGIESPDQELIEGVGNMVDKVKEFINRRRLDKFRFRFLQAGKHRVYIVQDGRQYALVEFKDKEKIREEMLSSASEVKAEVEAYEEEGYMPMNRPSAFRSMIAWIMTISGALAVATTPFGVVLAGIVAVESAILGLSIPAAWFGGLAVLHLLQGASGWWLVRVARSDQDRVKEDPINLKENLMESAPPSDEAESWIKNNKDRFKKEYGDEWENVLYATAWSMYNDGRFS